MIFWRPRAGQLLLLLTAFVIAACRVMIQLAGWTDLSACKWHQQTDSFEKQAPDSSESRIRTQQEQAMSTRVTEQNQTPFTLFFQP